ncbi:hypothetical protein PG996_016099 [Apiospora saccharicola]|uniref:Uncharacterized protein n=1 Tax=Apiospora saccharicola TaxID=335842 RepID=A0ABR1TQ84_9PEZI
MPSTSQTTTGLVAPKPTTTTTNTIKPDPGPTSAPAPTATPAPASWTRVAATGANALGVLEFAQVGTPLAVWGHWVPKAISAVWGGGEEEPLALGEDFEKADAGTIEKASKEAEKEMKKAEMVVEGAKRRAVLTSRPPPPPPASMPFWLLLSRGL